MASIRIDISNVKSTLNNIKVIQRNINNTKSEFKYSTNRIDNNIKIKVSESGGSIGGSIISINSKLNSIDTMLKNIENTIAFAIDKYTDAENKINRNLVKEYLNKESVNNFTNTNTDKSSAIVEKLKGALSIFEFVDEWSSKITNFIKESTALFNVLVAKIVPYAKDLKIDFKNGTYRVLGDSDIVKELGLARWYKPSTVQSKPNVDKIFKNIQSYKKISDFSNKSLKFIDDFGNKLSLLGGALIGINEFFIENKGKKIPERVTDTTIEVGVFAVKAAAGAEIGKLLGGIAGSLIAGPAGTAVGAAVGTFTGIAVTWLADEVIEKVINFDFNGDGKGAKDTVKDLIGNAANNTAEFFGNIGKQIIGNGVARINNSISVFA